MKYINHKSMKKVNYADIFSLIKHHKSLTRKEIEALTGLSWGAVSNITNGLLKRGFVVENKQVLRKEAGRIPYELQVNDKDNYFIGLDINISGMKAVLVNLKNEIVEMWNKEPDYENKDMFMKSIIDFVSGIIKKKDKEHIHGIGIAMQGPIDSEEGLSISIKECAGWNSIPICEIIENRFSIKVFLEHDPDCLIYAKHERSPLYNAILIRLDKSIGMAVMSEGRILIGKGMLEIGKILPCYENNGILPLEEYVTQNGMERLYKKEFKKIAEDLSLRNAFQMMSCYLGISIVNMCQLFNADEVILCGNMMEYKHLFYDDTITMIKKYIQKDIRVSVYDVDDAAFGAALIAIEKSIYLLEL
ncbi:MAG: ROK family transcriptional regulator [Clostridia bacterium]